MSGNILIRLLIAAAIVILAAPLAASAQGYYRDRSYDRYGYDNRDQYKIAASTKPRWSGIAELSLIAICVCAPAAPESMRT